MKLLIFDLDGTLIDSKRDIVLSVNRAFREHGHPDFDESRVGDEIGRGSEYLFKRLLGAETPSETIRALVASFKKSYASHLLDHTTVYPGIVEALAHYRAVPKVVVTNKNQVFADQLIDELGLRDYFAAVFGSEAFATQKPDPGPVLEVCRCWGVTPRDAAIIGDSPYDIGAGKAAGARTVAAFYGFTPSDVLKAQAADYEIHAADQLIGLFSNMVGSDHDGKELLVGALDARGNGLASD